MDRIRRLRMQARRYLGKRVNVELFNGREFEGRLVDVDLLSLVLRIRVRGGFVFRRIFFRNIREIDLED